MTAAEAMNSTGFKVSFIATVAATLNVSSDSITITSITDVVRRRVLLAADSAVAIVYVIIAKSITVESISTAITTAVSTGTFTETLVSQLVVQNVNVVVSASVAPTVINISPTAMPTYAPTPMPSRKPVVFTPAPTSTPKIILSQVHEFFNSHSLFPMDLSLLSLSPVSNITN